MLMKIKNFTILMIFGSVLFSCNDIKEPKNISVDTKKTEINSHQISQKDALKSLQNFLDSEKSTRGYKDRKIENVFSVEFNKANTRSTSSIKDCKDLLYVANFANDEGFAVLAADDRIGSEIIAVADKGSISKSDMDAAVMSLSKERPLFRDYPQTGPGIFTLDEFPGEKFMNPNTFSPYIKEQNDTLIGNLDFSDEKILESVSNAPMSTRSLGSSSEEWSRKREHFTCLTICKYALDEIQSENFGHDAPPSTKEKTVGNWEDVENVGGYLYPFFSWRQDETLNRFFPTVRRWILFGSDRTADTGCFPLSIAKVMAYFEYPDNVRYNWIDVNWKELKRNHKSQVGSLSGAALLRFISSGCDCWYFYQGTFTFPFVATSFMSSLGYGDARSYNYSFERVKNMIDSGRPLIIYAIPGIDITSSHCWNIDGYKIKKRKITTKKYVGGTLQSTTTTEETCKMVHCDFGWGGSCNGYYVDGIFKLNDSRVELDSHGRENTNYNTFVKVVMYEKPR